MNLKSHTSFIGSSQGHSQGPFIGSSQGDHRVKSQTLPLWYRIGLWWFWMRRVFWLTIYVSFWWSFLELVGPGRVIREAFVEELKVTFPINLFVKEDPRKIEEEARRKAIESLQAQCPHLHKRPGFWNYYCPLCGKKLIPGDHPRWQI